MAIDKDTLDVDKRHQFLSAWIYLWGGSQQAADFLQWSYHNLILEMAFHHFCHILFAKSKSLGPRLYPNGEDSEDHKNQETWKLPKEVGITWAFLDFIQVTWVCLANNTELGKW